MWNRMKRQLERFICEALKDRVSYYATTYRRSDDGMGRACIIVDGEEVLNCSYINWELNWYKTIHDIKNVSGYTGNSDDDARKIVRAKGIYSSYDFYKAAKYILNEPIEKCIVSNDDLVLSMALIDRRTGKRTLEKMIIPARGRTVQYFYRLRCDAESIKVPMKI